MAFAAAPCYDFVMYAAPQSRALYCPKPLHLILDNVTLPRTGLYLVGGSIRDMLLDRPLKDLDLVCQNARAFAETLARSQAVKIIPLGQDHDPPSWRIIFAKHREQCIDLTEMAGPDIFADLGRRDFTANALALRLGRENELIDPFNGVRDIRQGLLRHLKPSTFQDDPLRILRGFRLRTQLHWTIASATMDAMAADASLLSRTAGERVGAELRLILDCPHAYPALRDMAAACILDVLFPEITAMRGCRQNRFHHLDVFEHSLAAIQACEALLADPEPIFSELTQAIQADLGNWRLPWLKLAILLHDAGKPSTRALHPRTQQATFYGHDLLGAQLAHNAAYRLKLSRVETEYLVALIRRHLHTGAILTPQATPKARMRLLRRLGPNVIPAVLLCLADTEATQGPASTPRFRHNTLEQGLRLIRDSLGASKAVLDAPALLSGHDLIALGMRPGPKLGRVLKILREAQDAGEVGSHDEALRLAKTIARQAWRA